ncbi:hypothetical protein HY031_00210 [Candidatus Gottesmanbacteria bacterium]|nr:hypothetical protein [Candidatus Gottesmanbacteria bacterium]
MEDIQFEGQQTDERILSTVSPHPLSKYLAIGKIILLAIFFYAILILIGTVVPDAAGTLKLFGLLADLILLAVGIWWNTTVYGRDRTYITDRRIIRFDVVSPFFTTKRELFWNEALKAKSYAPNLFYRSLKIGTVEVEPLLGGTESVVVRDCYFFEDLANYVDKILYTFKNKPEEIGSIMPFILKPRGKRDQAEPNK